MSGTGFLFILAALVQGPAVAGTAGSTEILDRAELMDLPQLDWAEGSGPAGLAFVVQQRGDGATAVRLYGAGSDYVFLLSDSSNLVVGIASPGEHPRVSIERPGEPEPAGSGDVWDFAVIAHYD